MMTFFSNFLHNWEIDKTNDESSDIQTYICGLMQLPIIPLCFVYTE